MFRKSIKNFFLPIICSLLICNLGRAAGPSWMPNFPMRMGAAGVMLMWMPVPGASGYKVLRKIGDGDFREIAKAAINNYQDAESHEDQDLQYKVIPIVGGADGDESTVATLVGLKPVVTPTELMHMLDPNNKTLSLRWQLVSGAAFYNVYRSDSPDKGYSLQNSENSGTYIDAAVKDGTTYYYQVTAVSTANKESEKSSPYKVEVVFPKVVEVKKFTEKKRFMKLFAKVYGEDFAEFRDPDIVRIFNDTVLVVEGKGIQILNLDGKYLGRVPVVQEKLATQEWTTPGNLELLPDGGYWISCKNQNAIRLIKPDGTDFYKEIIIPRIKNNKFNPVAMGMAVDDDGNQWITDSGLSDIVMVSASSPPIPEPEEVERFGWHQGSEISPKESPLVFYSPTRIKYFKDFGLLAIMEPPQMRIALFDPKTKEHKGYIGGMGGALNNFQGVGDYVRYDENSLLVYDHLGKQLKRIDKNGDYIESWVDNDESLVLKSLGSGLAIDWLPEKKRLYIISKFDAALYIFDVD